MDSFRSSPRTIRPEICFRLVVFLDASRLADADLEKTTVELLAPSDSLDRFRALVLSTGILDFVFSTLISEAEMKLWKILQRKASTAQIGFRRLKDFQSARDEWTRLRQNQLAPASIADQQKNPLAES